jgi:4-hydroxy-tetrahydrodipicolinate synthase
MKKFRGSGVAIVTPFKNDSSIDFSALGRVVEHIIQGGINYIVVLGTTGESVTLTKDEKKAVISYVVETINGRVPLIVGIGGNNTQDAINTIKHTDLSGIDGILSVVPYYNKPTQRGLFQHFKSIATCSPVPVIMYNIPGRTGCNMTSETCLELANECDNIVGIKEASGDMGQIMRIIKGKPDNFGVISGDDMLAIPVIAAGGSGVISVLGNAFPAACSELVNNAIKNNYKSAREIHFKYLEIIDLLFTEGNPAGVKAMMSVLNICQNYLRLPLVPVSRSTMLRIQKAVEEVTRS